MGCIYKLKAKKHKVCKNGLKKYDEFWNIVVVIITAYTGHK